MYNKPKVGDIVICIDDDSGDEDLGMSGIVLKGTVGLKIGEEYVISELDSDRNVPEYNPVYWTKEQYKKVAWGWHQCYLKDKNGRKFNMFLHYFKPKR